MNFNTRLRNIRINRGLAFGLIIITALIAFEIFNYSTTDFALRDLLGDLRFAGFQWATILSIAFCGIDFAGIARLFTPGQSGKDTNEVWYLFGAWILAAAMNATLTWWGVSIAISNHTTQSSAVLNPALLTKGVPVFVALMVWVIRILIIGSLSYNGARMFTQSDQPRYNSSARIPNMNNVPVSATRMNAMSTPLVPRPAPKTINTRQNGVYTRPEPTYHSISAMGSRSTNNNRSGGGDGISA